MSKLSIFLVNIHGLIRGDRLELGRDADTGGQTRYVMDLSRALSADERVEHVYILTRLIADKGVGSDYSQPREELGPGLTILRVPFGGSRYLRKELLWSHLDEAVDAAIKLVRGLDRPPDLIHGHYADGGYVGMLLARFFGLPFFFTGHSLGRLKRARLLAEGGDEGDLERRFNFQRRVALEESVLSRADRVIASTRHEIESQYSLYENQRLNAFEVIPPGFDLGRFLPYYDEHPQDSPVYHAARNAHVSLREELGRFLANPDKPLIISVGRPDVRKNLTGLVELYGQRKDLQAMANLAVFAGIRKDIATMDQAEREVLVELLLLMDKYDLYGKLALPKRHEVEYQIPELYRIAAQSRGAFVNLALNENFGLTLLEAAASGCPVVATNQGGPVDIVANLENGHVVDPLDQNAAAEAITSLIVDRDDWMEKSSQGIQRVRALYTWQAHVDRYLEIVGPVIAAQAPRNFGPLAGARPAIGKRLAAAECLFVSDIDGTLLGGDRTDLQALSEALDSVRDRVVFAVATGRPVESAREALLEAGVPEPEIYIAAVGTEIYYRDNVLLHDSGWASHLRYQWRPGAIRGALEGMEDLDLQEESAQRGFKVSYLYRGADTDPAAAVRRRLAEARLRYTLRLSHGAYLDLLPSRAGKGRAIHYLCAKWGLPVDRVVTAGDSGNDEDMLRGGFKAIVVANRSEELAALRPRPNLYLSAAGYAAGVLEGLGHFGVF